MTLLLLFAASRRRSSSSSTETCGLTGTPSSGPVLTGTITNHPMSNALIVASTNSIGVKGLKNTDTKKYLDADATVVLTGLLNPAGAIVAGTANIPMPYISGTGKNALFRGAIPHTVALVAGTTYTRRITATDSSGDVRRFDLPIIARA